MLRTVLKCCFPYWKPMDGIFLDLICHLYTEFKQFLAVLTLLLILAAIEAIVAIGKTPCVVMW